MSIEIAKYVRVGYVEQMVDGRFEIIWAGWSRCDVTGYASNGAVVG